MLGGCSSLVVKVMDLWLVCHKFEPSTTKDPPCRGSQFTLNMLRLKRAPVGVVWKLEEGGSSSGVILVT
ncbi:hypothetical protein TNCV_4878751 [Trichonephila clavipes]|nr:hypothetical protein TNCV_4878751 [Trichonephila clavipes]